MKKVLLLGAGMVAKPIADYLLNHKIELTIASRTKEKADKLINGHPNGKAISWTTEDTNLLDQMVEEHNLVVSLLPYAFHVLVASFCIKHKKNMVTTSYISDEMKALDQQAKDAGIILLNEIGVDPGFDHMTAMRIIDKVREDGGKVKAFYSLCGALPAPEEAENPFRYQFSWSPRGVILASNNEAKFSKDGTVTEITSENLFKNLLQVEFAETGRMDVYPNRDSLIYSEIYQLPKIETIYRGTLRYPNWCESMDAIKTLGLLSTEKQNFDGKSYNEVVAEQIGVYPRNVKEKVVSFLNLQLYSPAIEALEWLGYFSNKRVHIKEGTTLDITADLMQGKMMLPEGKRDMVIMQHSFLVENANGTKEVIKSKLIDFATKEDTSIARTVALPAAMAGKMILDNKIKDTGVCIPTSKTIYEPVLNELANNGIAMTETWGLPESEILP